jgi:hypothetical protein
VIGSDKLDDVFCPYLADFSFFNFAS